MALVEIISSDLTCEAHANTPAEPRVVRHAAWTLRVSPRRLAKIHRRLDRMPPRARQRYLALESLREDADPTAILRRWADLSEADLAAGNEWLRDRTAEALADPLVQSVRGSYAETDASVLPYGLLKRWLIEQGEFDPFPHTLRRRCLETLDLAMPVLVRAGLGVSGLWGRAVRNNLTIQREELDLVCPRWPRELDGFRVLHLSDFHVDGHPALADAICRAVEDVEVDLCVLTGDFRFRTFGPHTDAVAGMAEIVNSVRSRHGMLGILGNHDPLAIVADLEALGVRMLVNRSTTLDHNGTDIGIVAVDDSRDYDCDDLPGALSTLEANGPRILLSHTPELYESAAQYRMDAYLCGHTHGGQIRLPLAGPVVTNADCPRALQAGLWKWGSTAGHTSVGLGGSIQPVRLNCPPKVSVLRFVSGET